MGTPAPATEGKRRRNLERPIEVVIEHHGPVSFAVLGETLIELHKAAWDVASEFLRQRDLPEHVVSEGPDFFREHWQDFFWLEEVASGSSKLRGTFLMIVLSPVLWLGAQIGEDVLDKSERYDEFTEAMADTLDALLERFVATLNERTQTEDREAKRHGDRLRIVVIPSVRQTSKTRLL